MVYQIKTLLCVDDEANGLFLRKRVLEKAGYSVFTASCGEEAIKIYESQHIDAIILDYLMPGMNGLKVAAKLKDLGATIPIIMLSAVSPILDEALGLADLWINKTAGSSGDLSRIMAELNSGQAC